MDIKIELSTICFRQGNVLEKIAQCRELVESHGFTFGIQLHNSVTRELYEKIKGLDVGFTVHAPVFSDYFINLAHDDFDVVLSGFQNTALIMKELRSSIVLFHGFFMTHKPIKNDPANYGKVLRDAIDNKYRLGDTRVMNPRFLETEEYKGFQQTVKKNIRLLRESYPAYTICLENDFPGIGNGNQTPAHLMFLDCPIWLDAGHLWASSLLNKFDFYAGLDAVCKQCNVIGVHLNTNETPHKWDFTYPSGDTHSHFSGNSDMDMRRVIGILTENRITHFTIEITDGNRDDILFLIQQHRISSQKA